MFEGASAAVVTPFRDGRVDLSALRGVTRHLVKGELDGIVVVGSTGEGATLTPEERRRVLEVVLDEVGGHAFVVAGTGTNATEQTIQLSREAEAVGAQGVMLVTPYYNKPTPDGLVRHYEGRWHRRSISRSSSTTFPDAPGSTCIPRRWSASPASTGWWRSRRHPALSIR
jgi:4-hydroxy-tetrahydrodipicolinate synthase